MKLTKTKPSRIEARVMRRVYAVHAFRTVRDSVAVRFAALLFVFGVFGTFVSVQQVVRNMPDTISETPLFLLAAFLGTEVIVQLLTLAFVAFGVWIVRRFTGELVHVVPFKAH